MTKAFRDIFNLNIKYVEYLLEKSLFTHSYTKNISASGGFVESEIRGLFRNILPKRFHITHGYIVSAANKETEPQISPQVDMIVVDTLVPHSIFVVDKGNGMEIVPKEAVVGVFEIKRTLDKPSIFGESSRPGALEHLERIIDTAKLTKFKKDRFLPGGVRIGPAIKGGYYNNPIIGVLGLIHDESLSAEFPEGFSTGKEAAARRKTFNSLWIQSRSKPPVDIIASLDGMLYGLIDDEMQAPQNLLIKNLRDPEKHYKFGMLKTGPERSQAYVVSRILGFILMYIQNTTGESSSLENYFFNKSAL